LEYAVRLPESAELRFTPRADGDGDGPSVFRVALTLQGEPVRELLTVRVASGGTHPEVHVPLPGEAGRLALLGLHSAGPEESVGRWGAPGVYGFPEPPPPEAPGLLDRLEDLRRRLRGTGVLLIVLDAAAARHVGCYGYERDTTPEIDRLAAEGQVFEHAYSPTSYTGTAMASLWTSQHPEQHHHGVLPHDRLPTHRVVLAELLQEKNVPSTAFIGNMVATAAGTVRGFAEVNPLHLTVKQAGKTAPEESPLGRIEAWISKAQHGSFLTYVHYLEPHFPYNPPPPFDAMFGGNPSPLPRATRSWIRDVNAGRTQMTTDELFHLKRLYDGNLAAVDHEIGLLRRRLEAKGHWEELAVIVTADHGEAFWEHGHLTHAGQVSEEEVRIPLIIKLPGREIEPRRIAEPVDLLDVGATLADILGVAEAARPHFEGRSLLPALVGDHLAPRPLVTRTLAERPTYSFLQGRLKLVHDPNWGGSELYDLGRDQAEKRDLSEAHPVTTEVFRQSLYRWLRDLDRGEAAGEGRPLVTPENEEALRQLGYVE
jgi:arylsulfatase